MAANAWTIPDNTRLEMLNGTIDLDGIVAKMALFTSAWTPGDTYSTTNEVATGNGYTQGGVVVAETLTLASGVVKFDVADAQWTASGGSITARYAVIYVETANHILAYTLLDNTPANVVVAAPNTLTVQISASGVFTMTQV